jgi:hypothetical protein
MERVNGDKISFQGVHVVPLMQRNTIGRLHLYAHIVATSGIVFTEQRVSMVKQSVEVA